MIRTHEQYIQAIRAIALNRVSGEERSKLETTKLVYGLGTGEYRGRCARNRWMHQGSEAHPIVEIAATGEESLLQLAGTTLHELGHVLSPGGHDAKWKTACERLGLCGVKAAGQEYTEASFAPDIFGTIQRLKAPIDGSPIVGLRIGHARSCKMGLGTRGGKSRGQGSGSRLRLFVCACEPPVKARVGHDEFNAVCGVCNTAFKRG